MNPTKLHRRQLLAAACWAAAPAMATTVRQARSKGGPAWLLAAWQDNTQHHLGLLRAKPGTPEVGARLALPSRPHGLLAEAGGTVLAVARRPGDWLLRWRPGQAQAQWQWQDEDRRLNGHIVALNPRQLLTTETDRASGQGWLSLRATTSLRTLQAWPTGGPDPHQVLVLPRAVGPCPAGTVLVANGGITTLPETGRSARQAGPLDASLVAMSPVDGRWLGRWRLSDPWLSIRHLAWNAPLGQLGVALQAEHPAAAARAAAPVLALWDGQALHTARHQPALAGYGGDIVALGEHGYAVSCPRADAVALFSAGGVFQAALPQAGACALTTQQGGWWSGGHQVLHHVAAAHTTTADASLASPVEDSPAAAMNQPWSLDNHWQLWPHHHA